MTDMSDARRVADLVDQISPILAGEPPGVQAAVLADLLAMWLAGHVYLGDAARTRELRDEFLDLHIEVVRKLVPVNAAMIGTGDG